MTDRAHEFIGFIVKNKNVLIPCTKSPFRVTNRFFFVWEIFSFVFLSLLYANRLSLNTTKSDVLFVGFRQRSSRMSCPSHLNEDTNVPKVTSAKSLVVHVDEALTWAAHTEEISKKLTSAIGANRTFTIAALFGSFWVQI